MTVDIEEGHSSHQTRTVCDHNISFYSWTCRVYLGRVLVAVLHRLHDADAVPLLEERHDGHQPEDDDDKDDEDLLDLEWMSHRPSLLVLCNTIMKKQMKEEEKKVMKIN
ncbi:hypothetical protein PoB_001294400 [Plakobranchus ocellatus]|uniref:Uncharacterized protein n=1 Tax=Plakobranchus ocellatus TaxID=259542 RepID=A0AAV3YXJ3_9GAST|nr:hypothetical protein PoB_001294400 [Plakobranchus ocellatus]